MNLRALGLACAAAVFALNTAGQTVLMNLGAGGRVLIPGLADFRPALNRGVSFSLFTQDSDTGRYALMAVVAAISAAVAVAVWRASTRLSAIAYGLVLGGALGNLADRARFGGVFDFLFLHLGSLPLFICNLPDIAISAGVLLLFAEAFLDSRPR